MQKEMRRAIISGFLCLFALVAHTEGAGSEGTSQQNQWIPLFNGKDLTGWVVMHGAKFTVQNGELRLVGGMGWLRTKEKYQDFELKLEWKALGPRYDSGIFLRCGLEGKPWPKEAWQVNLRYNMLGGLVKGSWPMVPAESPVLPPGKWNTMRIRCQGTHVTLWINGKKNWTFDRLDPGAGYIGIQAEEKPFAFRKIQIRKLNPSPKALPHKTSKPTGHKEKET